MTTPAAAPCCGGRAPNTAAASPAARAAPGAGRLVVCAPGRGRLDAPYPEPATHTVQVNDGDGRYVVCDAHADLARFQITDGKVVPGLPT